MTVATTLYYRMFTFLYYTFKSIFNIIYFQEYILKNNQFLKLALIRNTRIVKILFSASVDSSPPRPPLQALSTISFLCKKFYTHLSIMYVCDTLGTRDSGAVIKLYICLLLPI